MAENEVRKILGDLTNKENEYQEDQAIKQVLPAPDMPFDLAQVKLEDEGETGYKNETGSGNESHSQTPNGVLLKLSYCNQNRVMSAFPQNFRALKQHVGVLFKLSRPFTLFYIDPTGDRVDIESNRDLRGVQAVYANSKNKIVKVHVWLQEVPLPVMPTGIPAADEVARNVRDETKLIHFNDKTRSLATASGAENNVVRQNVSFILEYAYGNRFYYRCWKSKEGCKGMWKIGKSGGEGKLCRNHTLSSCNIYQTQVAQQDAQNISDKAQPVFSIQQELLKPTVNCAQVLPVTPAAPPAPKVEEIATIMSKIKRALRELLPRNMYTAKPDFVNNLLRLYPEFTNYVPMINVMYCLVKEGIRCEAKANNVATSNIVLPSLPLAPPAQRADANDVTSIRTERVTTFGRAQIRSLCEDTCHELVMLISDFELNIVKSNYKAPQRYLLSCDKVGESDLKHILTMSMYDGSSKLYMPVGHCLMNQVTSRNFERAIEWFQKELGTFFKPSLFMTDYNFDLFHAVHVVYEDIPKFLSISDFIRDMWDSAKTHGMLKGSQVNPEYLKFLAEVPKLLFSRQDDIKSQFKALMTKHIPEGEFEEFTSPYVRTFLDVPSWYNIDTLVSTYKNIFLNCAKSQENMRKVIHTHSCPDPFTTVKKFEHECFELHEKIKKKSTIPIQDRSTN